MDEVARCLEEIEFINRLGYGNTLCWLNALGEADWRAEIWLIEQERTNMSLKTLDDYAARCHEANKKWWLDLGKPCHCLFDSAVECSLPEEKPVPRQDCPDCYGLGYARKPRNLGELLMLAVSELAEALEGHRKSLNDTHLPTRLMAEVELADFLIRMFDFCGGMGIRLDRSGGRIISASENLAGFKTPYKYYDNFAENLLRLTREVCFLHISYPDSANGQAADIIPRTITFAVNCGFDIDGAFEEKMEYNARRVDHTIENRLKAEGKAY